MMEILAPCGSFDSLKSAVCAGADAVYFGAGDFNARRNAQNFTSSDITDAVKYCHISGVSAYLTLNTLVRNGEIEGALAVAQLACECGIDGIIIQDVGLAELIARAAPDMPLHASTQMSVHSLSGVRFLHEHGYKRVVLSREVSKPELCSISEYANKNGVELEIFVQGALCMSLSGQCLFSALLGARSGNRGLCAGTCRLPFSVDNGNGFDLSLKDLNLYNYFEDFRKMKIASLKIEGRMKRPEYVAMAVDCAVTARDNPTVLPQKLCNLQKIFSRSGFTDGYYAKTVDGNMFGVRSEQDIDNSKEIMNSAHSLYRREYPHVAVNMSLSVKKDEPVSLTVSDNINAVTVFGDLAENAQTRPLDYDFAKQKLSKCGGTPFFLADFSADIENGLTLPSSALNMLKTDALAALTDKRAALQPYYFTQPQLEPAVYFQKTPKLCGVFHSTTQIPNENTLSLYIIPLFSSDNAIKMLLESGKKLAVNTPCIIDDEEKIIKQLLFVKSLGINSAVANNIGAIPLIKQAGLHILGGSGLNIFNTYTANSRLFESLDMLTLSYELSMPQMRDIATKKQTAVNVYGKIPLMILRNCPRKAHNGCKDCDGKITDRMNITFKLMCEDGTTHLYSDRPLYMADRLNEINADFALLRFTTESKADVVNIIKQFVNNQKPTGLYTRGMYQKGVL